MFDARVYLDMHVIILQRTCISLCCDTSLVAGSPVSAFFAVSELATFFSFPSLLSRSRICKRKHRHIGVFTRTTHIRGTCTDTRTSMAINPQPDTYRPLEPSLNFDFRPSHRSKTLIQTDGDSGDIGTMRWNVTYWMATTHAR